STAKHCLVNTASCVMLLIQQRLTAGLLEARRCFVPTCRLALYSCLSKPHGTASLTSSTNSTLSPSIDSVVLNSPSTWYQLGCGRKFNNRGQRESQTGDTQKTQKTQTQ